MTTLHKTKHFKLASLLLLTSFGLSACGGGGSGDDGGGSNSGGGGANSVQYTGNTQAADVSEDNAKSLSGETFNGTNADVSGNNVTQQSFAANKPSANSRQFVSNKLRVHSRILARTANANAAQLDPKRALPGANLVVNDTQACPNGGTVTLTGNVDDVTQLGSITANYQGCSDGYTIANGSATLDLDAYDVAIDEYTDLTLSTQSLNLVGVNPADKIDWQIGADIRAQLFYNGANNPATYRSTINLTIADNLSNASFKYENYVANITVNDYTTPTAYTLGLNGRIYHYLHGYVDIATTSPLNYSSMSQQFPDAGGPITYTGAANKKIQLTPVNATLVNVAVDADGDDFYEFSLTLPWTALDNSNPNNYAPVANAGADATITLGVTAQLDGSQSLDADYNLITFVWTVTSQPAGSNAGLVGNGAVNPQLTPDMVGSYVVQVTVSDGTYSDTDTVTITVTP